MIPTHEDPSLLPTEASADARPVVIAEAGVNHNGETALALELVDAAADAGADMVKFQAFSSSSLTSETAPTAAYQSKNTGSASQRAMLQALELTIEDFGKIVARCREKHIGFLCTPFDVEALGPLIELGMPAIKIASGELTNHPALRAFGSTGMPAILSTGMATLEEVREAISVLQAAGCPDLTLLHCTSLYPAPPQTLNLSAIKTLKDAFGLKVGYSDHSTGIHMPVAAVAMGATMVEKHVTLDRSMTGPDHAASILPDELRLMIANIHDAWDAIGSGEKAPTPEELETLRVARRSWHAARDLAAGSKIGAGDATPMRPADGIPTNQDIAGRELARAVAAGQSIAWGDLK